MTSREFVQRFAGLYPQFGRVICSGKGMVTFAGHDGENDVEGLDYAALYDLRRAADGSESDKD